MVSAEEHEQVLSEELEVLESIYIEELQSMSRYADESELSPTHLQIRVVPEDCLLYTSPSPRDRG